MSGEEDRLRLEAQKRLERRRRRMRSAILALSKSLFLIFSKNLSKIFLPENLVKLGCVASFLIKNIRAGHLRVFFGEGQPSRKATFCTNQHQVPSSETKHSFLPKRRFFTFDFLKKSLESFFFEKFFLEGLFTEMRILKKATYFFFLNRNGEERLAQITGHPLPSSDPQVGL